MPEVDAFILVPVVKNDDIAFHFELGHGWLGDEKISILLPVHQHSIIIRRGDGTRYEVKFDNIVHALLREHGALS